MTPIPEGAKGTLYVATNRPLPVGVEGTEHVVKADVGGYYLVHKRDLQAMLRIIQQATKTPETAPTPP